MPRSALVVAFLILMQVDLRAADIRAINNGAWSTSTTWQSGAIPGVNDNAFIGSTEAGALTTTSVLLTGNTTVRDVYLGENSGTSGTLELGTSTFTSSTIYYGYRGTGAIGRVTGSFTTANFDIRNGSYTANAADAFTGQLFVSNTGSLTLAENLVLSNKLNLQPRHGGAERGRVQHDRDERDPDRLGRHRQPDPAQPRQPLHQSLARPQPKFAAHRHRRHRAVHAAQRQHGPRDRGRRQYPRPRFRGHGHDVRFKQHHADRRSHGRQHTDVEREPGPVRQVGPAGHR